MQNLELIDSENGLEISIRDFVDIFNADENEEWEIDTPDGWQPITNVWVKGNKKTFDVETNDKLKTSVSTKHLFQRGDGEWEFIDNFKIGDTILTKNGKSIISKIFKRGEECVYDVTVNHINHRYFSDGFISHNSGVGKSIMLANLTANVLKQGYNVVYITLELAEKIVAKRIDSMFTSIAQKSILQNIPKVSHELERIREKSGRLFVKRMRESTTNAKHIVSYLKEFQDVNGITPDLLVVDYLDIMAPVQKIAADNLFGKDKYLSEEIRAVGFDFDCSIASASQMGRAALEADEIHQGHIQGGISKVNTVDNLIPIIQTEQMRAAGEYVLSFAKTRNSDGVGKSIILGWNAATLQVTSLSNSKSKLQLTKKHPELIMDTSGTVFDKEIKSGASLLGLMQT